MCNLSELKKGDKAQIIAIDENLIPTKVLEMGLLPHTQVEVLEKAPFGGPIMVLLGLDNMRMALRKGEAIGIQVEKLG